MRPNRAAAASAPAPGEGAEPPLESVLCPLCGGDERAPGCYRFPPFAVVRCLGCGAWYLDPRPPEQSGLDLYRHETYYDDRGREGYSDYAAQEQALRLTFRRFLATLSERGLTGGDLLEIGCAYGYLLDEARGHFERRVGVEMSPEAVERAVRHADQVVAGGLDRVEGRYDCIVAVQVIEHVYDPHRFLAEAVARLAPAGWLVIATPDMGSVWRRVLGRRWPSFKIPEHVVFYDRTTLARLLRQAGLEQVVPIPYLHAFPLSLVTAKLGLPLPRRLGERSLWIPGTTFCLAARRGAD